MPTVTRDHLVYATADIIAHSLQGYVAAKDQPGFHPPIVEAVTKAVIAMTEALLADRQDYPVGAESTWAATQTRNGRMRDRDGWITGNPAPASKFTQRQIDMPNRQVIQLVGQPRDQGASLTGKAVIPFLSGRAKHRQEPACTNQGRLIVAEGSMGDLSSTHRVSSIRNANAPAWRQGPSR